ncbi:ImmA/IrrE family metallo-endopeptidase (plasmid) [Rathayibacter sp. VKM Ac-2759]|uniref:ImmA/IrrE family metallo-endopeptidase n=1 Tax=Rathayibacter sp. VKM Ac-2759 TaxID=2609252 RepID=UPI001316D5AA|nr:ImmA/IrrE family metallo-endopeptidase [Rathayibacter sp. VKM Ac-2759]QHC68884.1 ImmA/IrrE family metallo-endopeptidase [Rathayibacter sp. VKM Ac-2759]
MVNTEVFEPRWASAPGNTILRTLAQQGHTVEDFADWANLPDPAIRRLITGEAEITSTIAAVLAERLGGSVSFWLRRDDRYRENREWSSLDAIAEKLPVRDMVDRGWIEKPSTWRERAKACLDFFGVTTSAEWEERYQAPLQTANFRRSEKLLTDDAAVAAWLRQAELLAQSRQTQNFSAAVLRSELDNVRNWCRHPDPVRFIPEIADALSRAGVSLVVLRTPSKCPVSGASKKLSNGSALIALSARYLADDHFWFTLFHEIAHLLLHGASAVPFVDEFEAGDIPTSSIEQEADNFASTTLVPNGVKVLQKGSSGPSQKEIVSFAHAVGVSPGIVVGQLQHDGIISFNNRNALKRRYRWDVITGELVRKR